MKDKHGKAYRVSEDSISQLETPWEEALDSQQSHLRVHQCLAMLLDILGEGGSSFYEVYSEIGKQLDLTPHTVRQALLDACGKGILSVSTPLAISLQRDLQEKLQGMADRPWYEEIADHHRGLSWKKVRKALKKATKDKKSSYRHLEAPALDKNDETKGLVSELVEKPAFRVIVGEVKNRYKPSSTDRAEAAASAAAEYFVTVVPQTPLEGDEKDGPTSRWIGVSGGNTMLRVVQHIHQRKSGEYSGLKVVPLAGEAEPNKFAISANSVVLRLGDVCASEGREDAKHTEGREETKQAKGGKKAKQLKGGKNPKCPQEDQDAVHSKDITYALMTTPIAVQNMPIDDLRQALVKAPGIKEVIDLAKQVKFAFTGIGAVSTDDDALTRLGRFCALIDEDEEIPDREVVGDVCYMPINRDGKKAWSELSDRLVGPTLVDLRRMAHTPERRVFAVACGKRKAVPIIAAVRGGLVNGLITDDLTAREILQEIDNWGKTPSAKDGDADCPDAK